MRRSFPLALLPVVVIFSACGGSPKSSSTGGNAAKVPAESTVPLTIVDPATAGTITGTITFDGTPPPENLIDMKADPTCCKSHGDKMYTETAVVVDGRVQWAFVRISAGLEGRNFGVPSEPARMDQSGCTYLPHLIGAVTGQIVRVTNSDETLHNVHGVCEANKAFNMARS